MEEVFDDSKVLSLRENLGIQTFSKNDYLISSPELNLYIRINEQTYNLIQLFDGTRTIKKIIDEYKNKYINNNPSGINDYYCIINRLMYLGVFSNCCVKRKQVYPSYILLRTKLFSSVFVNKAVRNLHFLFNIRTILLMIFGSVLIWIYYAFFSSVTTDLFPQFLWWIVPLLFIMSSVLHELGHSASATYYGAENGEIGMGFYFFQFVFYSNITDVWRLQKKQRAIVDLSGIYLEFIFSSIILLVGLLFSSPVCIVSALAIIWSCLFNLNPFIRTDGFWLFCDLINEPNVFKHIWVYFRSFKEMVIHRTERISITHGLVSVYGITCYAMTAAFVIYMLVDNYDAIIYFVPNAIQLFISLFGNQSMNFGELTGLLQPAIFYLLLFNWCKSLFLKVK